MNRPKFKIGQKVRPISVTPKPAFTIKAICLANAGHYKYQGESTSWIPESRLEAVKDLKTFYLYVDKNTGRINPEVISEEGRHVDGKPADDFEDLVKIPGTGVELLETWNSIGALDYEF